jgi:surfactin synthase thioesterase subunit
MGVRPEGTHPCLVQWSATAGGGALVGVPWAGAGAAPFRSWATVNESVSVYGIRFAGRESRAMEAPPPDLMSMVEEVVEAVSALEHGPVALFGHCSGALVAFEASHLLADKVSAVYVASQLPPGIAAAMPVEGTGQSALDDYIAPELRDDPLLSEHFRSLLASDWDAIEKYVYVPKDPLPIPITVIRACGDTACTAEAVAGWQVESSRPVTIAEVQGADHLFSGESWLRLANVITSDLVRPPCADRRL